jgi:hypothetical protein
VTRRYKTTAEEQIHDRDVREPSPSAGWRATYTVLETPLPDEHAAAPAPDRVAAATRQDRPPRYRRKHAQGVMS